MPSPERRVTRRRRLADAATGLGAAAAIAALVVGVPAALLAVVGSPLPAGVASWEEISAALESGQIAESTIVKAVSWLVWAAWAQLTLVLAVEVAALAANRTPRPVGPAGMHHLAARLVSAATLTWAAIGGLSPAGANPPMPGPVAAARYDQPTPTPAVEIDAVAPGPVSVLAGRVHRATHGDTWTSLAGAYLGDPAAWGRLLDANRGRTVAAGTTVAAAGPIHAGWELLIPAATPDRLSVPVTARLRALDPDLGDDPAPDERLYTVACGDNLWDIAETHLTGAWGRPPEDPETFRYWTELIDHNIAALDDNPDLIHPGDQLVLPSLSPVPAAPPAASPGPADDPAPPDPPAPDAEAAPPQTTDSNTAADQDPEALPDTDDVDPPAAVEAGPGQWPATADAPPTAPSAVAVTGPSVLLPPPPPPPRPDPLPAAAAADHPAVADGAALIPQPGPDRADSPTPPESPGGELTPPTERGVRIGELVAGLGVAAAGLAAGVLWSLRRRRRAVMARRPAGHLVEPVPDAAADTERALADVAATDDDLEWTARAIASLAVACPRPGAPVAQPLLSQYADGVLEVMVTPPMVDPPDPWRPLSGGQVVRLDRSVPTGELPDPGDIYPAPGWVTLGGGDTVARLSLEAVGALNVSGDNPDGLVASMVAELCTGPGAAQVLLSSPEPDPVFDVFDTVRRLPLDDADGELRRWMGDIDEHLRSYRVPTALTARAGGTGDPWPVLVLITRTAPSAELVELAARGGRAVAVVGVDCLPAAPVQVRLHGDQVTIDPWALTYTAQRLTPHTVTAVARLWDHAGADPVPVELFDHPDPHDTAAGPDPDAPADQPPPDPDPATLPADRDSRPAVPAEATGPGDDDDPDPDSAPTPATEPGQGRDPVPIVASTLAPVVRLGEEHFADPDIDVEVRVLGPVDVIGGPASLRGVNLALLAYLATRTDPVTLDAIRDAVWGGAAVNPQRVYTAASTLRTAIGPDALPGAGEHGYQLTRGTVTTDLARFQYRVIYADRTGTDAAVCTLVQALSLVRGQPFSATTAEDQWWRWAHDESLASATEAHIADIAHRVSWLAREERRDLDLAQWAAEQGLAASPHCDRLVGELMRAHLAAGRRTTAARILADHDEAMANLGLTADDDLRAILAP